MGRVLERSVFVVTLAVLGACSSPVQSRWVDPEIEGRPLELERVATVALLEEGALRRVAEDDLARAISEGGRGAGGPVEAVPSYRFLKASELDDADRAIEKLADEGFDGVVVLDVVDREQRVSSTPSFSTRWGWYGRGWGVVYDTSNVRTDIVVRVQTNIYSVDGARLLWSGTSRSRNPTDVSDLVRDVVRDVGRALREEGLILPPEEG